MDTSPRASGPAGPQFEAKVATHYALAVLAKTEAFGLPGAIVERIEFQRRAQGYQLDDIIIKGKTRSGEERCLEIQAKRSIVFTETDRNFSVIVEGIVAGHKADPNRMFAAAIERTSGPIENGVQEALELARATTTPESFIELLDTPGRSNKDMRRFVKAFRKHLSNNEITDDKTLFQLLKRFVVLVFDYARPQSITEHHDRMRAQQLTSKAQGVNPYDTLFGLVLRSDAIGGETDRSNLIDTLREHGLEIAGPASLAKARGRIEEMSRFALSDINTKVVGYQLVRADRRKELETCLDEAKAGAGIVEISGPGGVGKSALLKAVAEVRGWACRIMVLAPDRTSPGGWAALRNNFDIDASADDFFEDLSCDGGGLICIDGLDRFRDEGQQKTVLDVVRSALQVTGVTVLFTARSGWEEHVGTWIGDDIVDVLKDRKTAVVEGLNDEEASALAEAVPSLAPLLRSDHPAHALAHNLFILRRLARTQLDAVTVLGEVMLARDWWITGAHGVELTAGAQRARRRVLVRVCEALINGTALADVSDQDSDAVESLILDDVLVEIGATDRVKFKHDLSVDWALACFFTEDPSRISSLDLNVQVPFWLSRGFELSCRLLAESTEPTAWPRYLENLESRNAQSDWIGLALLALVRSEQADTLLSRFAPVLLQDKGERAATLIRRAIAAHGQSAEPVFKEVVPTGTPIPEGLVLPEGPVWLRLVEWCVSRFDALPSQALSASIGLFEKWMTLSIFVGDRITPILLECFADLLVARIEDRDRPLSRADGHLPKIRYPLGSDDVETARLQLAVHARRAPAAAARYLTAIAESSRAADELYRILQFPGNIPAAAPSVFVDAFRSAIRKDKEATSEFGGRRRIGRVFSRLEGPFVLGRSGIALFEALLEADSGAGLRLIREIVEEAEQEAAPDTKDSFDLLLAEETRCVSPTFSYGWSRGRGPSPLLSKALAALEHWAHQQIDGSESLKQVVRQIAGNGPISGALLLVIVDVVLSHSTLKGDLLLDLISSPETLALDATRAQYDSAERMSGGGFSLHAYRGNQADQTVEKELAERVSRGIALHDVISQVVFGQPDEVTTELRRRLSTALESVGAWTEDSVDWTSPVFIASHALRLAARENYEAVAETDGGERKGWQFRWPEAQRLWLQTRAAKTTAESESFNRALAIRMAMDSDQRQVSNSVADAEIVLEETKDASPGQSDEHNPNDPWINRVAAGAYLARFADTKTIEALSADLTELFAKALIKKDSSVPNVRYDVMYDPQALAIAGRLYLAIRSEPPHKMCDLLGDVGSFPVSAAAVFSRHREVVQRLGDFALRSAVRMGLQSCIFPRRAHFEEDDSAFAQRQSESENNLSDRLVVELSWLAGDGEEPTWPCPPLRRPRRARRGIMLPGGTAPKSKVRSAPAWPDFYFDDQTALVWLRMLAGLTSDDRQAAVATLLRGNQSWLLDVNGIGKDDEDDKDLERTWTRGVFECAALHAKLWSPAERQTLVFNLLTRFSDEAFIDAASAFLLQSDLSYVEGDVTDTAYLVSIREQLWARLRETHHWRAHMWSSRTGMEIHLKELIAVFFFKVSHGLGEQTGYTGGLPDDQLSPFLPILTEVAVAASPCPTIALLLLDVLEAVAPQTGQSFLVEVASSWAADADVRFWSELGIGRRVCKLAENAEVRAESIAQWLKIADAICAAGVAAGEALKCRIREIGHGC